MAIDPVVITIETKDETEFDKISDKIKGLGGPLSNADTQFKKTGKSFGGLLNLIKTSPVAITAAGVGIGALATSVFKFSSESLKAAGNYNNLIRGLEFTEGSVAAATQRFDELNEKAKLPSLDRNSLLQYNNSMKALGATTGQIDTIFEGLSAGVSTFGGNMFDTNGILLQFTQAAGKGKATLQDFKPIIERMPTFLVEANKALGTGEVSWDAFKDAVDGSVASGKSFFETMDPVFKQMQNLPGQSVDSYTNLMGNLGDAFTNLQASIGNKLLPTWQKWATGLLNLIEKTTDFVEGQKTAKESIEELNKALSDTTTSIESKKNALVATRQALEDYKDNTNLSAKETADLNKVLGILFQLQNDSPDAIRNATNEIEFQKDASKFYADEVVRLTEKLNGLSSTSKEQSGLYRETKKDLDNASTAVETHTQLQGALEGALKLAVDEKRRDATETETLKKKVEAATSKTREFVKSTKELLPELPKVATQANSVAEAFGKIETNLDAIIKPLQDTEKEMRLLHSANNAFGEELADVNIKVKDVVAEVIELKVNLREVKSPMDAVTGSTKETKTAIDHIQESMSELSTSAKETGDISLDIFNEALKTTKTDSSAAAEEVRKLKNIIRGLLDDGIDFIGDLVDKDTSVEEAFGNLADRIGRKFLDHLTDQLSGKLAEIILGSQTGNQIVSGLESGLGLFDTDTKPAVDVVDTAGKIAGSAGSTAAGSAVATGGIGVGAAAGLALAVPAAVFAGTYLIGKKFAGGDDDVTALLERGEIRNERGRNVLTSNALKTLANSGYPEEQKSAGLDAGISAGQNFRNRRRGESQQDYESAKEKAVQKAIARALAQAQQVPEFDSNTPEDPNALFHFKETDRMAQDVGSDIARAMFSPSDTQRRNARDFSDNVRGGALREIAMMRGSGQGKQVINLEVPVITKIGDKEVREVTKRQLEIDQQGTNYSVPIL